MRFLVDENLPLEIIEYLLSINHDVFDIAASDLRGSSDKILWTKAAEEKRIIITRDLDYPIPRLRPSPFGVILIRVPSDFKAAIITRIFKEALAKIDLEKLRQGTCKLLNSPSLPTCSLVSAEAYKRESSED